MERRDLIQDQIEKLGAVLAKMLTKILSLKSQGQTFESIQIVNQDLKDELGIGDFLNLSIDEFQLLLEKNKTFNSSNLEKLASNLILIAEDLEAEKSENLYKKSLKILELVNKIDLTYSLERFNKMKNIENILKNYNTLSS